MLKRRTAFTGFMVMAAVVALAGCTGKTKTVSKSNGKAAAVTAATTKAKTTGSGVINEPDIKMTIPTEEHIQKGTRSISESQFAQILAEDKTHKNDGKTIFNEARQLAEKRLVDTHGRKMTADEIAIPLRYKEQYYDIRNIKNIKLYAVFAKHSVQMTNKAAHNISLENTTYQFYYSFSADLNFARKWPRDLAKVDTSDDGKEEWHHFNTLVVCVTENNGAPLKSQETGTVNYSYSTPSYTFNGELQQNVQGLLKSFSFDDFMSGSRIYLIN
jgi:hypothetical protein